MDNLQIRLLGPLQVERNELPIIDFKTDATRALLGLLATQRGMQRRDVLATRLAPPDKTDAAALKYLRLALDRLRNALRDRVSDPPFLLINRKELGLADHVWVDWFEFERLIDDVANHAHREATQCPSCLEKLTTAVALYQGDVLAGLNFKSPDWQIWLREVRSQKQRQAIDALVTLAQWRHEQAARGQGEWAIALDAAQAILHVEAWHEQGHRWAMEAYWQMGQVGEAMAQYDRCVIALDEALAVAPSETTETLRQRVGAFADQAATEIDSPHNLTEARTAFFGRNRELTQLQTLLTDPLYRLVNVVGEGGMGKSRLAQEVGWQLRPSFPDGVWFVPLAGITTRDAIVAAIAQALDFTLRQGAPPLKQLLRFLRKAELLLILDNFEQLVDAADVLVEILNATSGVVLLCTSRKMLNLTEEIVLPLRGLEVETRRRNQALDTMQPAIQLFAARARRSDARFVLNEENGPIVEQIAQLLEGSPLGLELAASWARSRTAAQILQAIEDSADFLAAADGAEVDRRHHTIRAVFETSWEMLSPAEQALYPKLSLFRGGFSLEASEAIANATWEDLDLLVEKSMVQFDRGRYHIHELLRQFSETLLTNATSVETRFVKYFASYLETNGKSLTKRGMKQAMQRITLEEANIKRTWVCAIDQQSTMIPIMSDHLDRFYVAIGRTKDGATLIEHALNMLGEDTPIATQCHYLSLVEGVLSFTEIESRLRKLYSLDPSAETGQHLGRILWRSGKSAEAKGILQAATRKALQAGKVHTAIRALEDQGVAIQLSNGDDAATLDVFTRGLKLARTHGYVHEEAFLLIDIGQLLTQMQRPYDALTQYKHALNLTREINAGQSITRLSVLMCRLETGLKHYIEAVQHAREGLAFCVQFESAHAAHILETEMGVTLARLGQLKDGETYLQKSYTFAKRSENRVNESFLAKQLGQTIHAYGQYASALAYHEEALHKVGDDIRFEAEIRFVMGNTLLELGHWTESETQFTQAVESNRSMGKTHREIEVLAGLADLYKRQGKRANAQAVAAPVVAFINSRESLFGCEDDLHILWRLYTVFDEPRWLAQAHGWLMERAAQFGEGSPERDAYLNNLPVHRQILAAHQA